MSVFNRLIRARDKPDNPANVQDMLNGGNYAFFFGGTAAGQTVNERTAILNAYEIKTGLSRARLSHLMDGETWMNAKKALELGFCDEIAFLPESGDTDQAGPKDSFTFSRRAVTNCLMDKLRARMPAQPEADPIAQPETDPNEEPPEADAATNPTNPTDPENAEPPTPDASRVFVSDNDPKLQLIRYQLLWEGLPNE